MPTTTNYGWTTPADTDLVKDGASAIRTLGTAIDTTVFNNAGAAIAKSIVDAKGDIIAATAADTVSKLSVGANDTVLTADSSTATGLKWATPAATGFVGVSCTGTGTQTLSTATWTAITWDTEEYDTDGFHSTSSNTSRITVPAGKAGKYLFTSHINLDTSSGTGRRLNKFYKNGVAADISFVEIPPVSGAYVAALNSIILNLTVGDYVEIYYYQTTGSNQVVDRPSSSFQAQYLGA